MAAAYCLKVFTYLQSQKLATGGTGAWERLEQERVSSLCNALRGQKKISVEEASKITTVLESCPLSESCKKQIAETIDGRVPGAPHGIPPNPLSEEATGISLGATDPSLKRSLCPQFQKRAASERRAMVSEFENTKEQIHWRHYNFCTKNDWDDLLNAKCPSDQRMGTLGLRIAKMGALHLKELCLASVAALGMLDWPIARVNSHHGHIVLLKLKSVVVRHRRAYNGVGAPEQYPSVPSELPREWYEKAYDDGDPVACPVKLHIVNDFINAVPCRGSNSKAQNSFGRSGSSSSSSSISMHHSPVMDSSPPATGGRCGAGIALVPWSGPATGGYSHYEALGRAIAQQFPEVENVVHDPRFQQALQDKQTVDKLKWRQLLSSSPTKKNDIPINFTKALQNESESPAGSGDLIGRSDDGGKHTADEDGKALGEKNEESDCVKPTETKRGRIEDVLATLGGGKGAKAMKAAKGAMKTMKSMKAAKGAMKAMRNATGVEKTAMKAKASKKRTAMGVRGQKDKSFLNFFAGDRPPFWYGKSKVNTDLISTSHGRWRVYKNSPRDKVESSFSFSDRVPQKKQWEEVVALLKRVNS